MSRGGRRNNSCRIQVSRNLYSGFTNRIGDGQFAVLWFLTVNVFFRTLCFFHDICHGFNRLYRISTRCGFARKHYRIRTVKYRVGNITNFGSCRSWITDHGIQHLCGRDNRFTQKITFFNDALLHQWHFLSRDFYTKVPPGNHNTIRNR